MLSFAAPSAAAVAAHPGMVYVAPTRWLAGEEKRPAVNRQGYWIDRLPVKVREYLPLALAARAARRLDAGESVLLHELIERQAVAATGLHPLPRLMADLAPVFGAIDQVTRKVAGVGHSQEAAAALPHLERECADCPAPMSLKEARLFCAALGKRVPTAEEWELAARGVDGRAYPWGNSWDPRRGNAGLPAVGQVMRLRPSESLTGSESPFGLVDAVGNAGDWIDDPEAGQPRFMGCPYRFDVDSCKVYMITPDQGDFLPLFEVTVRCVAG